MSCGALPTVESPAPCETGCEYYEVARKLVITGTGTLVSQMVEVKDANVIEIDAQDFSTSLTISSVSVQVQAGNDSTNWEQAPISPVMTLQGPGTKAGILTNVSTKFVRLAFVSNGRSTRISAGIRLRTELPKFIRAVGPLLSGFEAAGLPQDTDYFLLADRLHVALGSSVTLAPVSMIDRNAVKLEIVVVQPSGLPISADVEVSNDAQTWETLVTYSGLAFGYNSPDALTGVSHRYVRVRVNGPQSASDGIAEVGMALSRLSP